VQVSHHRGRNIEILAGVSLLALGVACQFVTDVSDYRFEGRDAGAAVGALEPPPDMRSLDDDPPGASNAPALPATPRAGADDDTAPEPPENTPERPSTDAGAIPIEPDAEPPPTEPPPTEPPPTEPPPTEPPPTEPPPSEPPPPPPDPTYGCSYIEFCYAYEVIDTTDEERCIQSGCTFEEAEAECRAEIAEVCGIAPQPPFVLFTLSNERVILN
jgi:hypothetical protein